MHIHSYSELQREITLTEMAPSPYFFFLFLILSIGLVDMCNYAQFDKITPLILIDIKETKCYGRTETRTTVCQPTNTVCGGITNKHRLQDQSGVNAPVICIPGSLGAGDSGDIAGPKCRDLTFDESRQCRRYAGVLISRQKHFMPYSYKKWEAQSVHLQSDQLLFRCLDEYASWNRKYGCKTQNKGLLI